MLSGIVEHAAAPSFRISFEGEHFIDLLWTWRQSCSCLTPVPQDGTFHTHTGWVLSLPSPEGQLIGETFPREFISRESLCVISYPVLPLICLLALTSNWQHPTQLLLSTLLNYSTHSEWEGGLISVSPASSEHNRMEIREVDRNWFPFSKNLLN